MAEGNVNYVMWKRGDVMGFTNWKNAKICHPSSSAAAVCIITAASAGILSLPTCGVVGALTPAKPHTVSLIVLLGPRMALLSVGFKELHSVNQLLGVSTITA